jgi:CRP/FNR family transcriptional regulator, cyclic AMP receptor protein
VPVGNMSLGEEVRLLSMVDILEPLSQGQLEELARRVPEHEVEQGKVLYTPDEHDERLFLLKKGRVRVYRVDPQGQELTLSVAESGTLLGEMAFTGQHLPGVYLRAIEPSVIVALKRRDLEHLILSNPEVGLRLVRLLSERLHETETRLAELSHKEVPARLASHILRLIESEGVRTNEGYEVPTHYTHEQLATMIGSKRVAVSRAFVKLKEEGAVELRDRKIHVADLEALKRAAEA